MMGYFKRVLTSQMRDLISKKIAKIKLWSILHLMVGYLVKIIYSNYFISRLS